MEKKLSEIEAQRWDPLAKYSMGNSKGEDEFEKQVTHDINAHLQNKYGDNLPLGQVKTKTWKAFRKSKALRNGCKDGFVCCVMDEKGPKMAWTNVRCLGIRHE